MIPGFEGNSDKSYPGDPAQGLGINIKRPLTTTNSEHSIERAQQWIDNCITNHDCSSIATSLNKDGPATFRPTRLIALPNHNSAIEDDVCLVSPLESCRYVTLSYCWGDNLEASWVTAKDNLSLRQSRLGIVDLPRTLRDAIDITRDLGYNYLWVDAICIVQDSLRDWEHESPLLGSIYGNSCVTIAATSSANSSGGCYNLQSIDQAQQSSRVFEIPTVVSGQRSVLCVCCWFDGQTQEDMESPQQIRNGSLSDRGWAFQERLFSPRTLHYTTDQLFWECRRAYIAEDGLYLQPCFSRYSLVEHGETTARDLMGVTQASPSGTVFEVICSWYDRVVTPYTRRRLTRPKDKLVAVSAIAKAVHDLTGATYHAGIWLATIQFGLCWRLQGP